MNLKTPNFPIRGAGAILVRAISGASIVCLLAAGVIGCGPSASFQAGEQAAADGDWLEAVLQYRNAVGADPDDGEARTRLSAAEYQLSQSTYADVMASVAASDFQGAVQILNPAWELLPNDSQLLAAREAIRSAGLDMYRVWRRGGDLRGAYEGAVFLNSVFTADGEVAEFNREVSQAYAVALREEAETFNDQEPGNAMTRWAMIWFLTHEQDAADNVRELRRGLREEIRLTYFIEFDGRLADQPSPQLDGVLAQPLSDRDDASVDIRADLDRPSFDENYTVHMASHRYLAGYEEVTNPEYTRALEGLSVAQQTEAQWSFELNQRAVDAREAAAVADAHQGQADHGQYYQAWERAQAAFEEAERELPVAISSREAHQYTLEQTAPTVLQEVYADYNYEVRDYTLTASARFALRLERADEPETQFNETLFAHTTDASHEGHEPVGLVADPLNYPDSHSDLVLTMQNEGIGFVRDHLLQVFNDYRQGFRDQVGRLDYADPIVATEALVRYVLLEPGQVAGEVSQYLYDFADLSDVSLLTEIR